MAPIRCNAISGYPIGAGLPDPRPSHRRELARRSAQRGRTLVEMVIVVAIVALAAAVALPSVSPTNHHRLELAAARVADAFRFAREEARRTGLVHGVSADLVDNQIRVFRLDQVPDPNQKIYDVRHPVTRQPYSIQVDASPHTGVDLTSYGGQMVGACNAPGHVAFDARGVVRCTDPTTTRIRDAAVVLAAGQITSTVAIESYTGAVSVQ